MMVHLAEALIHGDLKAAEGHLDVVENYGDERTSLRLAGKFTVISVGLLCIWDVLTDNIFFILYFFGGIVGQRLDYDIIVDERQWDWYPWELVVMQNTPAVVQRIQDACIAGRWT